MSRIGKKPSMIPAGVTVTMNDGVVVVTGPKGSLTRIIPRTVDVKVEGSDLMVTVHKPEDQQQRALWGTWAAHIRNLIIGVVTPFVKVLEVNGVGYRVSAQGQTVKLEVGYSHPVAYELPAGVTAKVEKNILTIESINKEILGRVAAEIRAIRKPEPYKGKGIKYSTETIRRKAGKAAKTAA